MLKFNSLFGSSVKMEFNGNSRSNEDFIRFLLKKNPNAAVVNPDLFDLKPINEEKTK